MRFRWGHCGRSPLGLQHVLKLLLWDKDVAPLAGRIDERKGLAGYRMKCLALFVGEFDVGHTPPLSEVLP
jgi:hypothetical protein